MGPEFEWRAGRGGEEESPRRRPSSSSCGAGPPPPQARQGAAAPASSLSLSLLGPGGDTGGALPLTPCLLRPRRSLPQTRGGREGCLLQQDLERPTPHPNLPASPCRASIPPPQLLYRRVGRRICNRGPRASRGPPGFGSPRGGGAPRSSPWKGSLALLRRRPGLPEQGRRGEAGAGSTRRARRSRLRPTAGVKIGEEPEARPWLRRPTWPAGSFRRTMAPLSGAPGSASPGCWWGGAGWRVPPGQAEGSRERETPLRFRFPNTPQLKKKKRLSVILKEQLLFICFFVSPTTTLNHC